MTLSGETSPLTADQRLVLQMIYDHFRAHATWPTFISIDRPLRREHGIDAAAIVQTLPESLIVRPRSTRWRPKTDDELQLRMRGIHACLGGSDDAEQFVRLLRWIAQQEIAYEPELSSEKTMPHVTSSKVAGFLGLCHDDLAVTRLYAMLQFGYRGLDGSGSSGADGGTWCSARHPEFP